MERTDDNLKKTSQWVESAINQYAGPISELADRMDINQRTIYKWRNGKITITTENIIKLSSLTGADKSEIRPDLFG